ncbi:MAG TPA: glycosyl transferase [Cytophagales bacterium]|jgi:glycosyltransferase involved in cell wall biosynthesis|nr:glycosyl transferase [Cytophagales bacterium]
MKNRIAIYIPSLRGGGAERVMVTLANAFVSSGYYVDLVVGKADGSYIKDVSEEVAIVDLDSRRVTTSLPGLVRYLRRAKPNALLSAMVHANIIAIFANYIARSEIRLVVSEHNTLNSLLKTVSWLRREKWLPFAMRLMYPKTHGIVAVSKGVADELSMITNISREKIDVIYNPVVINYSFPPHTNRITLHPWFGDDQPPVILSAGRLTPQKDFTTLIYAFAKLLTKYQARLVIMGEGEQRNALEQLIQKLNISDKILLPGFVDNPREWMQCSSLFVLSSSWEGFGNVILEAMACGLPIVSTDCPSGPAEILEQGVWGRLVPVGDFAGLAEAMYLTLHEESHPDVVLRASQFSVEKAANKYLTALGMM